MEKQLSWVLKLSLKEIATRRVIINLWNEAVISALGKNLSLKSFRFTSLKTQSVNIECYVNELYLNKVIEDMVKDKLLKLVLPESLKKRMMHLVTPIGSEILKWQIYHENFFHYLCENSHIRILKQLYWTSTGIIDYRKTAEALIRHEIFDVVKHYQLACSYCLVDYIPLLWKELPEETKQHFYDKLSISFWGEAQLDSYWAYVLKGEESKLDSIVSKRFGGSSFHQYAFEGSARKGNKTATEYFLMRLSNRERNSSLFRTIYYIMAVLLQSSPRKQCDVPREKLSDLICYFLSIMTSEEQMKVFMEHPCEVLGCFLDWPWQYLFLDIADIIWSFLPESKYDTVLYKIAENIQLSDFYFPDLIQNFLQRSPNNFRKFFVNNECTMHTLFPEFFSAEDTETIKVIFRMVDAKDRARLVSSYPFYELFDGLMMKNKWQLVELCLREALLSREERERLKKAFRNFFANETSRAPDRRLRLKQFVEFLDKIEANNPTKRNSEEIQTNIKKLCSKKPNNDLP